MLHFPSQSGPFAGERACAMNTQAPASFSESDTALSRRGFLRTGSIISLGAVAVGPSCGRHGELSSGGGPLPAMRTGATGVTVRPVLTCHLPRRRTGRSWRNWGGIHTETAVKEETARIDRELGELCAAADFDLSALPAATVSNVTEAEAFDVQGADVLAVYAAGGWTNILDALASRGKPVIIFIRKRSGPYYLWDEIVSSRFLRRHTDTADRTDVGVEDVVVDEPAEMLWRLRALHGLKNTLGRRVVCVGGPAGWSCPQAPQRARERFNLDMPTAKIAEVCSLIEAGRKDAAVMKQCRRDAADYVGAGNVTLSIPEESVAEAFLLKKLFFDLMEKHDTCAVTTNRCMNSYAGIMPCLTLTLINDEGYLAFCESDFVVIPAGILMHYISGRPSYFCNPTFPHDGRMIFAHCTAPRRMDGRRLEPVELVTHYESDHGAATHVAFRKGQEVTIIKPDFAAKNWLAMTGEIVGSPVLPTCRGQVDVRLDADTRAVAENLRGFHCMLAYGNYTREVRYAAGKVGINVQVLA